MKLLAVTIASLLLLLPRCQAAKGGAKTIMRKKTQQGANTAWGGYYGHSSNLGDRRDNQDSDGEGELEGSGDMDYDPSREDSSYYRAMPCVGLCLLYKERGQVPPAQQRGQPCVGTCQHRRQLGLTDPLPEVNSLLTSSVLPPSVTETQETLRRALLPQETESSHSQAQLELTEQLGLMRHTSLSSTESIHSKFIS